MADTLSAYVWINYAGKTSGDMSGSLCNINKTFLWLFGM